MLVALPILDTSEGFLITRASGLFSLVEEALTHSGVLIECCAKEPRLHRHAGTIQVMLEHVKNATNTYTSFANALAIPRGDMRRLLYRLDKLTSLGVKLAAIVETSGTKNTKIIVEKSNALKEIKAIIRASVTLLVEGKEWHA